MLHWWIYKRHLSAYADHSLSTAQFRAVWGHLHRCFECQEELQQLEHVRSVLRRLPSPAMPADLAFQVRILLCQERGRQQQPTWSWRWATQWGPLAVPALTGVLSALLIFGIFVPQLSAPLGTRSSNDVPLVLRTPARLRDTGPIEHVTNTENLVVQVLIDHHGRVADYDIVSGSYSPQDVRDLRNRLLFTVFDPATVFGRPMPETLLLSFRSIRVRG